MSQLFEVKDRLFLLRGLMLQCEEIVPVEDTDSIAPWLHFRPVVCAYSEAVAAVANRNDDNRRVVDGLA